MPKINISQTLGKTKLSEGGVNDLLRIKLSEKPTADVTINFVTDTTDIKQITPLTFTPNNWQINQQVNIIPVADTVKEGKENSSIKLQVSSQDSSYHQLAVSDIPVTIVDQGIPDFPSYRTVEETYRDLANLANNYSAIAQWSNIGESYDKIMPGGPAGYNIKALELTNKNSNPSGGKPVLFVQSGLHAREYAPVEVVTRFAENLVNNYGVDPDITWLLDYFQINLVPITNPDGRKLAEQGYYWRKNTNSNSNATFPNYGIDLNRNYSFQWNNARLNDGTVAEYASSGDPSDEGYRGEKPFSEPETQALSNYIKSLFPNHQGPKLLNTANPDATVYQPEYGTVDANTSGLFIDMHSYGDSVLYPWGWYEDLRSPNNDQLRTLGRKYGYFTNYDVMPGEQLYPADGASDDWTYGTLGVPAYTMEIGTDFFEPSSNFEQSIYPDNLAGLIYMAKSARRPYQTPAGPDSLQVKLDNQKVFTGMTLQLGAIADDTRYADSQKLLSSNPNYDPTVDRAEPIQNIKAGRYTIGQPSWIKNVVTKPMSSSDGSFNNQREKLQATIDTTGLTPGRYQIFVESQDSAGNWGVPTAVFLDIAPTPTGTVIARIDNTLTSENNNLILTGTNNINGTGNNANNQITGNIANNRIVGKDGNDLLRGGAGADQLLGNTGSDRLQGDAGNDTLTGGAGQDRFIWASDRIFTRADFGQDLITDWQSQSDLILLKKSTFSQLTSSVNNPLNSQEFAVVNSEISASTSSAVIVYDQSAGKLYYNPNLENSGFETGGLLVTLNNLPNLQASNFVII